MLVWHRRVLGSRVCKGVARPSTYLAIIQAMSNCPGYFPRLLLWVVLPHSVDGRSQCAPASCAGSVGPQGRRKHPVQHYERVLDCILLAWVLGQEPSELTSPPQRAIHTDFHFVYEAKKTDSLCCKLLQALSVFHCYLL